ncbi:hypothetical protein [Priestia aryabhattai]|uniref:hypothetical protein n=1 Tax=Priestia aryabhattai TaxID=412384 RepID=UPI00064E8D73|nr:hypothetical protein [Priestia aryabhattai]KML27610.1 hypothetical protein VL11_21955 [Priestia aryabhattai]KMN94441.1 hypothetical protein ABV89_24365 [Priestia aryabhattai]
MYLFEHAQKRKKLIRNSYLSVFILSLLLGLYLFFTDYGLGMQFITRGTISVLFHIVVFYFAIKNKQWALFFIKVNVLLLIIMLIVAIIALMFGR